jgi:hypothetical protein
MLYIFEGGMVNVPGVTAMHVYVIVCVPGGSRGAK